MATDRYSDDHKIVVGGGSGTLTVDANLNVSSADDINIESTGGDINLTTSSGVVSINDFDISKVSSSNHISYENDIYWHSDYLYNTWRFDKNTSFLFYNDLTHYDFEVSTKNLYLSSRDDVYITAGIDTADSTLLLSANNSLSPYIRLKKDTDTIDIVADIVNITQAARANTTIMPGSSFLILESYSGSGDSSNNANLGVGDKFEHTTNGNVVWSMDTVGSGYLYGHVFAPLPESIPDGSVITNLGVSLDRDGDTNSLVTTAKIRVYKFSDGADEEWGTSLSSFFSSSIGHKTDYESLVNILPGTSGPTITLNKKEKAYSIKIQFRLTQGGSRCDVYLTSVKIGYTTTKFDPNI